MLAKSMLSQGFCVPWTGRAWVYVYNGVYALRYFLVNQWADLQIPTYSYIRKDPIPKAKGDKLELY